VTEHLCGPRCRRSREVTHLCLDRVTRIGNGIWNVDQSREGCTSSIIHAGGVCRVMTAHSQFHLRRCVHAGTW